MDEKYLPSIVEDDVVPAQLNPLVHNLANRHRGRIAGLLGRLLYGKKGDPIKSLMVTSGLRGEGKSTVAIALGVALATTSDSSLLLVDCNLDNPIVDKMFGIPMVPGLSDVVLNDAPLYDCIWPTNVPNLHVLPWGTEREYGSTVLGSKRFRQTIAALRDATGFVIADTGAILAVSDMLLVISAFEDVINVVRCEHTTRDITSDVKNTVEGGGGNLIGTVLNQRRYYLPRMFYNRV